MLQATEQVQIVSGFIIQGQEVEGEMNQWTRIIPIIF